MHVLVFEMFRLNFPRGNTSIQHHLASGKENFQCSVYKPKNFEGPVLQHHSCKLRSGSNEKSLHLHHLI